METVNPLRFVENLNQEEAERISRTLYDMLGNAIGYHIAKNIIEIDKADIGKGDPLQTLTTMLTNLNKSVGKQTLLNMVYVTIITEYGEKESKAMLERMKFPKMEEIERWS